MKNGYDFLERVSGTTPYELDITLNELRGFKNYLEEQVESLCPKREVLSERLEKYQKLRDQKFLRLMFSKSKKYKHHGSNLKRVENINDKNKKRLNDINRKINSLENTIGNLEKYFGI